MQFFSSAENLIPFKSMVGCTSWSKGSPWASQADGRMANLSTQKDFQTHSVLL